MCSVCALSGTSFIQKVCCSCTVSCAASVQLSMHVLPLVIGVPCTGKCVRKEQPDRTVCSMPMDLPLRLECEERASHKPTGIGDEVSRRTSSLRAIVSSAKSKMPSPDDRRRAHVERMLARARKRSRQAQKIVAKWEAKLMELDREGVATKQPRLWQEEQPIHCERRTWLS